MNILAKLQERFASALNALMDIDAAPLLDMIKPSQDPKFGDYQANCAMPLGKRLNQRPREVAQRIVELLDVADLCEPPEIAGPGFINLRIRDDWIEQQLSEAVADDRLTVATTKEPKTFVVDYSAPNVAKPMHVGHIRSTVIGDALSRTLQFLGHTVISDNHIGDWGTQFGMIIYGYKHFLDENSYQENAVAELARLYRFVNRLIEYHKSLIALPALSESVNDLEQQLAAGRDAPKLDDKKEEKKRTKNLRKLESRLADTRAEQAAAVRIVESVESDSDLAAAAAAHDGIAQAVLNETAALHSGDTTNRELWKQFLPACLEDINRIYRRLDIKFDHTLGESFYQDRLASVVDDLKSKGLARDSDGAVCVFFDNQGVPMIVQKKDGAFLYATTDLATIQYREETWQPNAILYVVDHRQSLHFEHLFAAAQRWGYSNTEFVHVKFGTVLGEDGRPFKTRSGSTVDLDGLVDEAVKRALQVVSNNDDAKPEPELNADARQQVAETVGIAALKYADLSQNRESDYVFSYDKMLALNGNTATYMQYAYARVRNIFAKGDIDIAVLRDSGARVHFSDPAERALALAILQFEEALGACAADLRPSHITTYLFNMAEKYSTFYNACPVLKADSQAQRDSRLLLCDLTARTLQLGLSLLGICVIENM